MLLLNCFYAVCAAYVGFHGFKLSMWWHTSNLANLEQRVPNFARHLNEIHTNISTATYAMKQLQPNSMDQRILRGLCRGQLLSPPTHVSLTLRNFLKALLLMAMLWLLFYSCLQPRDNNIESLPICTDKPDMPYMKQPHCQCGNQTCGANFDEAHKWFCNNATSSCYNGGVTDRPPFESVESSAHAEEEVGLAPETWHMTLYLLLPLAVYAVALCTFLSNTKRMSLQTVVRIPCQFFWFLLLQLLKQLLQLLCSMLNCVFIAFFYACHFLVFPFRSSKFIYKVIMESCELVPAVRDQVFGYSPDDLYDWKLLPFANMVIGSLVLGWVLGSLLLATSIYTNWDGIVGNLLHCIGCSNVLYTPYMVCVGAFAVLLSVPLLAKPKLCSLHQRLWHVTYINLKQARLLAWLLVHIYTILTVLVAIRVANDLLPNWISTAVAEYLQQGVKRLHEVSKTVHDIWKIVCFVFWNQFSGGSSYFLRHLTFCSAKDHNNFANWYFLQRHSVNHHLPRNCTTQCQYYQNVNSFQGTKRLYFLRCLRHSGLCYFRWDAA